MLAMLGEDVGTTDLNAPIELKWDLNVYLAANHAAQNDLNLRSLLIPPFERRTSLRKPPAPGKSYPLPYPDSSLRFYYKQLSMAMSRADGTPMRQENEARMAETLERARQLSRAPILPPPPRPLRPTAENTATVTMQKAIQAAASAAAASASATKKRKRAVESSASSGEDAVHHPKRSATTTTNVPVE
jgi:hypothetical protein